MIHTRSVSDMSCQMEGRPFHRLERLLPWGGSPPLPPYLPIIESNDVLHNYPVHVPRMHLMKSTSITLHHDHCDRSILYNLNITGDLPTTLTGLTSLTSV